MEYASDQKQINVKINTTDGVKALSQISQKVEKLRSLVGIGKSKRKRADAIVEEIAELLNSATI